MASLTPCKRQLTTKLLMKNRHRHHHHHHHHSRIAGVVSEVPPPSCVQRRFFSRIPEPTWSIKDLQLTYNHPALPKEEVQRLSRRALIHIDEHDDAARQDLANMMHMVEQVSAYSSAHMDADEIYDEVRGVTAAPLRSSNNSTTTDDDDREEAANVWQSQLQPNTIKVGGSHEYFVITTKEE
jgi:hypothetical protein